MEGGRVTGLRGIGAARRPSTGQPVRCGGGLGALHDPPELEILTNLVEAEVALDVASQELPLSPAATVLVVRRRLGMQP